MEMRRRDLLKWGALHSALIAIPSEGKADQFDTSPKSRPSIVQGATDETHAQFSIVYTAGVKLEVRVFSGSGQEWLPTEIASGGFPGVARDLTVASFSGLSLGIDYELLVKDASSGQTLDRRSFRTLDLRRDDLKFALCSCMEETRHRAGIWNDLVQQNPDVIFFIGDSVYCDKDGTEPAGVDPKRIFRRFSESRAILQIYFSDRLIPIFATWDDHDFGQNDSGKDFRYIRESQESFQRFFPQNPGYCVGLSVGPGIARALKLGGQQFLLLDDRSFRITGSSNDRFAHWGEAQENWIISSIENFEGPTWLFNGTQLFPKMMFKQSVSGDHPVQLAGLLGRIKASGRKVLFGTGDVHFSEVSLIEASVLGYPTIEITSSSIHSFKLPGLPEIINNPRRIHSTGNHNYILVESRRVGAGCTLHAQSRSEGGRLNFEMDFTI